MAACPRSCWSLPASTPRNGAAGNAQPSTAGSRRAIEHKTGARLALYTEQERLGGSIYELQEADNPVALLQQTAHGQYCDA